MNFRLTGVKRTCLVFARSDANDPERSCLAFQVWSPLAHHADMFAQWSRANDSGQHLFSASSFHFVA